MSGTEDVALFGRGSAVDYPGDPGHAQKPVEAIPSATQGTLVVGITRGLQPVLSP